MNHRASRIAAGGVLLAALLGVSSASSGQEAASQPVKGGELVVANLPVQIDPMTTTRRVDTVAAQQACEGLFATDAKLNVEPGLVSDYTYDEAGKTYTFHLRSGVPFHGGSTLSSADVVASLTRFAASVSGANFASLLDTITAPDDLTVVVKLKSASAAIPTMLAVGGQGGAYIMTKSLMDSTPPDAAVTTLDCTGPYKLASFVPDQEVVFTRFDGYVGRTEDPSGAAGKKVAWWTRSASFRTFRPTLSTASEPAKSTSARCRSTRSRPSPTTPA
jgi:peptide/nickel transport system substrate-binding protein